MDACIAKIYNLLYSPIVTPYNLLENAKLDNYEYVNYYKGVLGLIVEMKCFMDEGQETIFYYHFDKSDKLIKICEERGGKAAIVFDRNEELKGMEKAYLAKTEKLFKADVV